MMFYASLILIILIALSFLANTILSLFHANERVFGCFLKKNIDDLSNILRSVEVIQGCECWYDERVRYLADRDRWSTINASNFKLTHGAISLPSNYIKCDKDVFVQYVQRCLYEAKELLIEMNRNEDFVNKRS